MKVKIEFNVDLEGIDSPEEMQKLLTDPEQLLAVWEMLDEDDITITT